MSVIPRPTIYGTHSSPYVRKVQVLARELGVFNLIDWVYCHPLNSPAKIRVISPVAKVPTMVLDNQVWIESDIIGMVLTLHFGQKPIQNDIDLNYKRDMSFINSLIDATLDLVRESKRPESKIDQDSLEFFIARIIRLLKHFELVNWLRDEQVDYRHLSLAVALGYLDFRVPDLNWRKNHSSLEIFLNKIEKRPSLAKSMPHDGTGEFK